jgi:formylglycine-generating enzyme required for sulfatase activity
VDPVQTDYLRERLVEPGSSPEQTRVIRKALEPYRGRLSEGLWQLAADPKEHRDHRFRAALALALFDADSPHWPRVAPDVVGYLLAQNTAAVGRLLELLRPVRLQLVPALHEVFDRRDQPAARAVAADVLADFAADQPDLLVRLLQEADDRQWATLWPIVQKQHEQTLPLLSAALDETLTPDWKDPPLRPEWTVPDPSLVRQIEAANGMVAERFALCQTMSREQFLHVAEGLRPCGYRPTRFRPYAVGGAIRVAAVWTRDGRDWQMACGLSIEQVGRQDESWQGKGYLPADAAGYPADGERYAVLWEKSDTQKEQGCLYVGVPEARHKATYDPLREKGYGPITVQTVTQDGMLFRYSAVWRKPAAPGWLAFGRLAERGYSVGYQDRVPIDVHLVRRAIPWEQAELMAWFSGWSGGGFASASWEGLYTHSSSPSIGAGGWYTGIWGPVQGGDRDAVKAISLDPVKQLESCRELAARGYRPAAITVADIRQGLPLVTACIWHRPVVPEADKDSLARRQAQAAAALLKWDQGERVWPLLRLSPDPRLRTYLLHRLGQLHAEPRALLDRLERETDVSARRALVLSLGEYTAEQLPEEVRRPVVARLLQWYRDDPDPGVHSAIDWLLRYGKEGLTPRKLDWQQGDALGRIDLELLFRHSQAPLGTALAASPLSPWGGLPLLPTLDLRAQEPAITAQPAAGPGWYVNSQGQTLAILPGPLDFLMGAPGRERGRTQPETLHRQHINRTFAIGTKDVTIAQYQQFATDHPEASIGYGDQISPDANGPAIYVNWYRAAQYCRWLSEREGIPEEEMCYPTVAEIQKATRNRIPLHLPADYLRRTGYRLPTEAEWEYACRAGTETRRYFGMDGDFMLDRYAWHVFNSGGRTWPVGQKKPNDFGLFDMYGSAAQWCQEGYRPTLESSMGTIWEDIEDKRDVGDFTSNRGYTTSRMMRGSPYSGMPSEMRSAYRFWAGVDGAPSTYGFRIARTCR